MIQRANRTGTDEVPKPKGFWMVAVFALCLCVPATFDIGPISLTPLRAFLLIVTVPLSIGLISGRYGKINGVDVLIMLHLFWTILAMVVIHGVEGIEFAGATAVTLFGSYLVGRAAIRSQEQFVRMIKAFSLVVLFSLPFSLGENLTNRSVLLDFLDGLPGITAPDRETSDQRLGLYRAQGTFLHPIHYGIFCSMIFGLSLLSAKSILRAGLSFTGVMSGLSSAGLLGVVVQSALIGWNIVFQAVKARWKILGGLFAFFYIFVEVFSSRSALVVLSTTLAFSAHNAYWRRSIFEYGIQNVWANPWFGIGLDDWMRPDWMAPDSVDNYWLLMAMRYGIPGFLTIAAAFGWLAWRLVFRDMSGHPDANRSRLASVFALIALVLSGGTVHLYGQMMSFAFLFIGAAIWLAYGTLDVKDDAPEEAEARAPATRYSRFGPKTTTGRTRPAYRRAEPVSRRTARS